VGALLSGGIDSSLTVALMQRHASLPVRTFTVGFTDGDYDESVPAAAVAARLGTDHTAVPMTAADVARLVPGLADMWDEPFADTSQLPTALVAAVARRSVTVALTGDGGDELFAGYNRHAWLARIWRRAGPVPRPLRRPLGAGLRRLPPSVTDTAARALPGRWRVRLPADKVAKVGRVLEARGLDDAYAALVAHWDDPTALLAAGSEPPAAPDRPVFDGAGDLTGQLLAADLTTYLPDDVLTKVDRASMAVSLEARTPFLDRGVLEVAGQVPPEVRIRDGETKWVLRRVLDRHLPRELVDRPKMGFGVPVGRWLRGPLRPWAEDLLSPAALGRHQLVDPEPVRRAWARHQAGRRDLGDALWDVLMLQAWADRWAR
jgi:asparagine synthase (glutamine-hydrolysing)